MSKTKALIIGRIPYILIFGAKWSNLTAISWLRNKRINIIRIWHYLERATGLEPATSTLARLHSTNWVMPAYLLKQLYYYLNGAGNETRTRNFNLGKVALYHWVIPAFIGTWSWTWDSNPQWTFVARLQNWCLQSFGQFSIDKTLFWQAAKDSNPHDQIWSLRSCH